MKKYASFFSRANTGMGNVLDLQKSAVDVQVNVFQLFRGGDLGSKTDAVQVIPVFYGKTSRNLIVIVDGRF